MVSSRQVKSEYCTSIKNVLDQASHADIDFGSC